VTEKLAPQEMSLGDEIFVAETLCRRALEADYPDLVDRLPSVPKDAEGCFELLCGIPYDQTRVVALRRLRADAELAGLCSPYAVERFVVLQAYLVALSRLRSLPVDESVNRQFCATCRQLASPLPARESRLAQDSDAFAELAQIVTLRRFHAGQLSFDIASMPRAWLLRVHPLELPGLIREIVSGIGGLGPVVMPHINYWRANPMFIFKGEQERALWRITKSIEHESRIKGLITCSWLYSIATGECSPHLVWIRDFYVDHNAYVLDLGSAPVDSGFLVGSEIRRRLYAEGKFHPRETLVLWRRADMLAWANSHPELGEVAGSRNARSPNVGEIQRPRVEQKSDANRMLRSGQYTLIDCKRLLFYKSRHYIAIVLLLPALCAAILAAAIWTVEAGCLAFIFSICFMWLFQYFVLQ
jgi:hypothetical protein